MNPTPAVASIGAGAIGGAMAAALGDAGHTVNLCVRTPFDRLSRTLAGETHTYDFPMFTDPGSVAPVDWVLLCTKAHQIEGAAAWLDALVGPDTRVAVMQNGVDHRERVARWVPPERAAPCVILLPASVEATGRIAQGRLGKVQVPDDETGRALRDLFAGQEAVSVEPMADFVTALWSKLVLNAVGGAVCSLAIKPLRAMVSPAVRELALELCEEVMAVGRAEGATFPQGFAEQTLEFYRGPVGSHWTSIAADRRDGRPMEWDARNAVVGRIGRKHGVATPLNDALTALMQLVDEPIE